MVETKINYYFRSRHIFYQQEYLPPKKAAKKIETV